VKDATTRFFAPLSTEEFASEYWQRRPLHIPRADPGHYQDVLTIADLDRVLTSEIVQQADLKVVKDNAVISPERYVRGAGAASYGIRDGEVGPEEVLALYREGCTLVFLALDKRHGALADLRLWAEQSFGGSGWANIYLTPPNAGGFGAHFDPHDVFVLQVHGSKHWVVRGASVDSPIATGPWKKVEATPAEPVLFDITLHQGDLLYIPRGFVHQASTAAEASAHVTLGLQARTWRDVLIEAVEQFALADPVYREALSPPALGTEAETTGHVAERAGELFALLSRRAAGELAEPQGARFGRLDQRQALRGQLVQLEQARRVTDGSVVRLRPNLTVRTLQDEHGLRIAVRTWKIKLPPESLAALEQLITGEPCEVRSLPLEAPARKTLVRQLIQEGVLVVETM
jgi:hypothetical protein